MLNEAGIRKGIFRHKHIEKTEKVMNYKQDSLCFLKIKPCSEFDKKFIRNKIILNKLRGGSQNI